MDRPVGPRRSRRVAATLLAITLAAGAVGCEDPAEYGSLVEDGGAALAAGDSAGAIDAYRRAAGIEPANPAAHFGLTRAYWSAGRFPEAREALSETLRLAPNHRSAGVLRVLLLGVGSEEESRAGLERARVLSIAHPDDAEAWQAAARAALRLGDLDEAVAAAGKAVALAPEIATSTQLLARIHVARGEPRKAEPLFQRLCEANPRSACFAEWARAIATDRARDDEVVALFENARSQVPATERADTYVGIAELHARRGRLRVAEENLRRGMGAEASSLHLLYSLARIQAARGNLRGAGRTMTEATSFAPYDIDTQLELSRFREEQGDFEGALAAAERALGLAPLDGRARLQRAGLSLERSRRRGEARGVDDAEREALHARELNPFDAAALELLARVELTRGRFASAADLAWGAIALAPESSRAWHLRAEADLGLGAEDEALASARRALTLEPTGLATLRLLSRIHEVRGEPAQTTSFARRVLLRDPGDQTTRVRLALSLAKKGQAAEARALLEEVPRELRGAEVHRVLAGLLLDAGALVRARDALDNALHLAPESTDVLEALLELDRREGRLDESRRRIRMASREHPADPRLVRLLARAARLQGDTQRAAELETQARLLAPEPAASPAP